MTLSDVISGPGFVLWAVFTLMAVISIVLLSGHGSGLIAGYNTADSYEKSKYDEKKLCRITGAGMGVISVFLPFMACMGEDIPFLFTCVFLGVTVGVCVLIIVLANTVCKK